MRDLDGWTGAVGGVLWGIVLAFAMGQQSAEAQEPVPAPRPEKPAADSGDGAWERLIYLPYKNLKTVFDKHGASVLIPYLEYLKLREQSADGMKAQPDKPPVEAVITESHYTARIDKDLARIRAEFKVRVLDKPWAEVPVAFGNAAVGEISSDDDQALLRGTGNGKYSLLLPAAGEHTVTLELVAKVRTSPEGRSFEFACPNVGITTFELVIPEAGQSVVVEPRQVSLPVKTATAPKLTEDGPADDSEVVAVSETRVRASLGSTSKITARWHPQAGLKPDMDLLLSVRNQLHVSVEQGLLHTNAALTYQVLRGQLNQLQIAVPLGHRILDLSTPDAQVKGWKAEQQDNRQLVTVDLLAGASKKVVVNVHTESRLPDGPVELAGVAEDGTAHGVHAVDAVRESGYLIVTSNRDLSLTVEDQQGLTRVDKSEVGQDYGDSASYYKFYSPAFRLNVLPKPVEPRVVVQQRADLVFADDLLSLRSQLVYQIERTGVFGVTLFIPEDVKIDNVTADGMKGYDFDEDALELTISLSEKRQGRINVAILGHVDFEEGIDGRELMLPLPTPLDVERETGTLHVFAPPSIDVVTDEDAIEGAFPMPGQNVQPPPGQRDVRLTASWIYSRRPVEIFVTTQRKPTRLTAQVGTTLTANPETVQVVTRLAYQVEHAGIDTFRFDVPEAVASRLQINVVSGQPIKQETSSEPADGWVTKTVVVQQQALGRQEFQVKYDLTSVSVDADAADEEVPSGEYELAVSPIRVLGLPGKTDDDPGVPLSRVVGEVSVLKDQALSVEATADGDAVEPVDVRELDFLPRDGFLAFRYYKQPVELSVTSTRYEIQRVVETVVSRALMEAVIGRDANVSFRCRYRIRTSERQRLAVLLPAGAEPLGVWVDRRQVNLERNTQAAEDDAWDSYFVNVARGGRSDEEFLLTLRFVWEMNQTPFDAWGGSFLFRLPQIGDGSEVVVQQLKTAVWIPEELALVGSPDDFVRETRPKVAGAFGTAVGDQSTQDLERWIGAGGSAGGIFDFPTEGHAYTFSRLGNTRLIEVDYWTMWIYSWALSVALVVVAVVLGPTSWENKLTMALLAAFVVILVGIWDVDLVFHALVAARWGLVVMVGYWLIRALSGLRMPARPPVSRWTASSPSGAVAAVIPPPGVFEDVVPRE